MSVLIGFLPNLVVTATQLVNVICFSYSTRGITWGGPWGRPDDCQPRSSYEKHVYVTAFYMVVNSIHGQLYVLECVA